MNESFVKQVVIAMLCVLPCVALAQTELEPSALSDALADSLHDLSEFTVTRQRTGAGVFSRSREVRFQAGGIDLAGTLRFPERSGPRPAVVLISGGGPHDRDGSYGDFKPMKMLAAHLASQGIVSLRYDDPGVGSSGGRDVMQYLMKDYVTFVSSAVALLKKTPGVDARRIGLIGLSQGAGVAAEVAAVDPDIAFIVLLSCHAVPGEQLFLRYQRFLDQQHGKTESQMAEIGDLQTSLFDCLRRNADCRGIEARIRKLIEGEYGRLPADHRRQFSSADAYAQTTFLGAILAFAHTPNFLETLDYSILPALSDVRCPLLIVFGEREEFVDVKKNIQLLKAKLSSSGNERYVTHIVPNATHLFLEADSSSTDFAPDLLPCLTDWLAQLGYTAN